MSFFGPWIVVFAYLIPMIGTLVAIWRRAGQIWRIGDTLRAFLPDDRIYRKIRGWDQRFVAWKKRYPLVEQASIQQLNLLCGKLEYAIGHTRDYTIGLWMMGGFVFDLTLMVFGDPVIRAERFLKLFYHGLFALLTLWTYRRHVAAGLQMTEFMRVNPQVHPQEFFDHYYRRLGPMTIPIPERATRTVDPTNVSYRTGRQPRQTAWIWIHGAYDTALFARSAYRALVTLGPVYGREVFDVMASLWGSRMLQLFKTELRVKGIEKFAALSGKIILVFNHKTYLDFVFGFFSLSCARRADGRTIRPRFLAAKDHLYDNTVVYSGFGIGRLIEAVDMIFVDRKGKGKQAIQEACQRIAEKEIEIAMYPQGTRALANYGPNGERRDAGYYTTGNAEKLRTELGHLKKGAAHLALETSQIIKGRGEPVHLVCIGTRGIATIQPKGSYKIQTEGVIDCEIGEVLTLDPAIPLPSVEELQDKIDRGLVRALHLHDFLKKRFLEELKEAHWTEPNRLMKINGVLAQADRDGNRIPFKILDRVYALPPAGQAPFSVS